MGAQSTNLQENFHKRKQPVPCCFLTWLGWRGAEAKDTVCFHINLLLPIPFCTELPRWLSALWSLARGVIRDLSWKTEDLLSFSQQDLHQLQHNELVNIKQLLAVTEWLQH